MGRAGVTGRRERYGGHVRAPEVEPGPHRASLPHSVRSASHDVWQERRPCKTQGAVSFSIARRALVERAGVAQPRPRLVQLDAVGPWPCAFRILRLTYAPAAACCPASVRW